MREDERLLQSIKSNLPSLASLLETVNGEWSYEDLVYRFYHQSFKVYRIQQATEEIVSALKGLAPEAELNPMFLEIYRNGTGRSFTMSANQRWLEETRPMLEAFFHARYFLEMAVKYGRELESAGNLLPSGWAGFLYLFNLR